MRENQGNKIGKVSECCRLDILEKVACQHDGLKLGKAAELTIPHYTQLVEG